jgi:hypothetical protein
MHNQMMYVPRKSMQVQNDMDFASMLSLGAIFVGIPGDLVNGGL